ncbi:MAG TPA: tryptophan 7-halogenase [Methylomirabilota bacterium]|nr:tryptophan 7-halogenase [Methylomirabilota bacterium]
MSDQLIVIPAFNEAATIADIVRRARRHGSVLVVDDGSSDGTGAVALNAGADVRRLERRQGKGEALRQGLREGLKRGVDRVVTMDGDGQHDPDEIPRLLAAAREAPDALVIGGRLSGAGANVMPPGRLAALRVAGFFLNWLTGAAVTDTQSGFRVYPAGLIAARLPRRGGFVLESEALLRAAAGGWRIVEIPVRTIYFAERRSRFRPARDGIAVGTYLAAHVVRRWAQDAAAAARALVAPFGAARRVPRHRELFEFTAPHRAHPAAFALAVGAFALNRTVETWRGWWHEPRVRAAGLAAAATVAAPVLLGIALLARPLARIGLDPLTPLVRWLYDQRRLARVLTRTRSEPPASSGPAADFDVLVVGGGPAGSTMATVLARGGLSVAVVERERFPRFHVGESLLPANLPVLERLGVLDRIRAHGFIDKYGASFHDQETGLEYTFYFREGKPWPPQTFEVPRAEFDTLLLEHAAAQPRVTILQPATVEAVAFDADGVTARVSQGGATREVRVRFLVDASGRDTFLASRLGRREPMPGLGKVALFAHFRGARRWSGKEEGNIRIFIFEDGWFWYIPFAGDVTSVGCVLHARTVRGRERSLDELFEAMIARCGRVKDVLATAERITVVHSAANFSYRTDPVVGDRFVCVGDTVAFVDPIFSSGVFIAMQSAELAAGEILKAFHDGRFEAARFKGYERRFRRGVSPFFKFIRHYYEPSFLQVFLRPRETLGMLDTVTGVLAGGAFLRQRLRMRLSLALFFLVVRWSRWTRRRRGDTVESRLEW